MATGLAGNPAFVFQSTLPRGSDVISVLKIIRIKRISIHAPSRERLFIVKSLTYKSMDFNPRSLAGATNRHKARSRGRGFQSTLPRGSDNAYYVVSEVNKYFNPRSLAGATMINFTMLLIMIFQSTLPRGSDKILRTLQTSIRNFNPRSLAGATVSPGRTSSTKIDFNPRSLAGAT